MSELAVVAAVAVVAAAALRAGRDGAVRPLWLLAVGGLVFEAVHLGEHLLQVGYWALHPDVPPWITPWAATGRDALAVVTDGRPASGSELLHLVGNAVFLAAVVAALAVTRARAGARGADPRVTRPLVAAVVLQGLHVLEHVALTATWFASGEALGVTTLFGALAPDDPRLWATRVWAHLVLNVAATVPAFVGAARAGLWRPPSRSPGGTPVREPAGASRPAG